MRTFVAHLRTRAKTDAVTQNNCVLSLGSKKTIQYKSEERCNFYIKMRQKLSGLQY